MAAQDSSAQLCSQHTFIGDSPSEGRPGWHDGTQGLAHDRANWYVTDTNVDKTRAILWRIPVTTDLAANVTCDTTIGVSCSRLTELAPFSHYNHYGDPDFYEFNGQGYVLVPVEGRNAATPVGVLIFRANETLDFLALRTLPPQTGAPWVAVDSDGVVYSSNFDTEGHIRRYRFDWAAFQTNGEDDPPPLLPLEPMFLRDEAGAPLPLRNAQGAEFSDDGRRFYVSSGNGRGDPLPSEGLHVFRHEPAEGDECFPRTSCILAHRIEQSHNSSAPGFSFEFHPGFPLFQEPEGLTFWDLDADGRAPGMGGQLHVVLLDNNSGAEQVYVKHYTFADVDSDPPTIACPAPAIVECVSPAGVASSDSQLAAFFAGASARDICTSRPRIDHDAPAAFPLGTTPVTFTATDDSRNTSSCQALVTVLDTTSPTISVTLSQDLLWPPDHRLVEVTAHVTVADTCGHPAFELVSISSNEPDDGIGDGRTIDDIQDAEFGTSDTSFVLRAERSASGQGREYMVSYRVTDGNGNRSTATAVVRVPHSQ
jgi:hypothetical protein